MQQAIRAFIAIELPKDIQDKLFSVQLEIQAKVGGAGKKAVRWVPSGNIHLTLKFLGEVSESNLNSLSDIIKNETARHAAFTLTIRGLGAFPSPHRPRIIWVGSEAPLTLSNLQKGIDLGTQKLGYPGEDRSFSPHLTLGRIAQNAHPDEVYSISQIFNKYDPGELGQTLVSEIHLFRSDLHPGGAVYTSLMRFSLANE